MPGDSYPVHRSTIRQFILNNFERLSTILDVGCGRGTYYDLLHDDYSNIDGVLIFKPNIELLNLLNKYRCVFHKDICDFDFLYYDIIILGDVLEHISLKRAINLVLKLYHKCKLLIISIPYNYLQDVMYGNVYELHLQSTLTHLSFMSLYKGFKLLVKDSIVGVYVKI